MRDGKEITVTEPANKKQAHEAGRPAGACAMVFVGVGQG